MRRLLASLVAAIGLMLVILTPTVANAAIAQVSKPDAKLTATWWDKIMAIPGDSLGRCDVGTGRILFLAGTAGGDPVARSCTTDKRVFLVPLINVECSESEPPDFFKKYAELRACAKGFADDFTDLKLVVDGQPVGNLNNLRVQAKSHFTPLEGNIFGTPPANNSKFAAYGYWALVTLTPGQHTITFGGSYPPGPFTTEVTYRLLVQN
jgi:hypothetical protein